MDLGFNETNDALSVRIRAHLKFSSMKIEDRLEEFLDREKPARIADIGCGSGNYTETLAKNASFYLGLDKSAELLGQATSRAKELGYKHVGFMKWDMNQQFCFVPETFDFIFFGYSAYYTNNAAQLVSSSKHILDKKGALCMVGPLCGNAVELDTITMQLLGKASTEEKEARVLRLEQEFVPLLTKAFADVQVEHRDYSLQFPDKQEYLRYYLATPQYIEFAQRSGAPSLQRVEQIIEKVPALKVTKKAVFLWAKY
jgi:ubiquinone/menaquinone biosynthesis C-methylase UbiE